MESFRANLWIILNIIIGTEEQVLIRRTYYELLAKITSSTPPRVIYSGSKAEGLDLAGSDYDLMVVLDDLSVSIEPNRTDHENNIVIETENIKPGFVRIRFVRSYQKLISLLVQTNDGLFISSLFFRDEMIDVFKHKYSSVIPHEPCALTFSTSSGQEYDSMGCLPCSTWPALEWRCRRRNYGWPPQVLVQKIIEEGCLLVPIGNPCSPQSFIEWRISFSLAEKRLVHSFNHTQLLCYGLLKLYLKHVINSNAEVKDLLCSYYLKTSLFYCIEEENISWCKENIFDCFWTCFRRLLKWVQQGYCPNFFIKENNMMEGKIYGDSQRSLLRYLRQLQAEGHESLRQISCLSISLSVHIQRDIDGNIELRVKEYLFDLHLFSKMYSFPIIKVEKLVNVKQEATCIFETTILQYWYNYIMICHTQQLYRDTLREIPNKTRYKEIKELKRYIKQNSVFKCTGMLILATLCYLNGEYKNVISIVEQILKNYGRFITMLRNPQSYLDEIGGRGFTLQQKMDLGIFSNLFFCEPGCGFYPQEIESELLRWNDANRIFIPAVPYSNVLLVLSYCHLKQTRNMNFALNELYLAVHGEQFLRPLGSLAISLLHKCTEVTKSHQRNL